MVDLRSAACCALILSVFAAEPAAQTYVSADYTTSVSGNLDSSSGAWEIIPTQNTAATFTIDTAGGLGAGVRIFYDGQNNQNNGTVSVVATIANAINDGETTFASPTVSAVTLSASNAISGGVQNFVGTRVYLNAANAISGGTQSSTGVFYANTANAISGGTQNVDGELVANTTNAISGGTQNFTGTLTVNATHAVSGGTQTFSQFSRVDLNVSDGFTAPLNFVGGIFNIKAANAFLEGTTQTFSASQVNISVSGGLSAGTQNFSPGTQVSHFGTITGGTQNFRGTDSTGRISGGTQNYSQGATYTLASNLSVVSGGTQTFSDNAQLLLGGFVTGGSVSNLPIISASNTLTGGTQIFRDNSRLMISDVGDFAANSHANAITGGTQTFSDHAVMDIEAAGAVTGATITLKDESSILTWAHNGLGAGTSITFDASGGGTGGTFNLNNYNETVGRIDSVAGGGLITNAGQGNVSRTLTVQFDTATSTYGGLIADGTTFSNKINLTKAGTGTLVLTNTNTYSGVTTINGGELRINGSAANSAFTVNGGVLSGGGTIGALTIAGGGTLAPGNSPGVLHATDATWNGGGAFNFQINARDGTAGGDPGWDLLALSGALTINASSSNVFTVNLQTLGLTNLAGVPANFDPAGIYTFSFVTAAGGISGFDPEAFTLGTSGVDATLTGSWSLSLGNGGHDLQLTYDGATAIPEPAAYALIAALITGGCAARRKRRDM